MADEGVRRIVDHIAERIAAARIETTPCDNIYIEDALPAALYREMMGRLPPDEALDYLDHPDAIRPDGRRTRKLLDLTEESGSRLPEEDRTFWRRMAEALSSQDLLQAMIAKFRKTLDERFAGPLPEMVAVPLFYRDYPGYFIRIHPDSPGKLMTLQFYLPADESQMHLGTTFHRRTETGFEAIKTNAFRPNSAYAFVRTDESWHSVKELAPYEDIRNTIALTVYMRGQEYRSARRYE